VFLVEGWHADGSFLAGIGSSDSQETFAEGHHCEKTKIPSRGEHVFWVFPKWGGWPPNPQKLIWMGNKNWIVEFGVHKSTWFTALTSPFPILWFTYIAHPSMELDHTIAGCIQWMAALYRPRILIYHPPEMARMHIKLGPMLQVTAGNSPQFIVTCVHVGAGTAGGLLINMCT